MPKTIDKTLKNEKKEAVKWSFEIISLILRHHEQANILFPDLLMLAANDHSSTG